VQIVGDTVQVAELDYATTVDSALDARFELVSTSDARADGFVLWFDSELAPGIVLSNSPSFEETIYSRAFFPFQYPVDLRAGDRLSVRLRAALLGSDYTWTWDTDGLHTAAPIRFRQCTFRGIAIR
jgi:hypothetical protein